MNGRREQVQADPWSLWADGAGKGPRFLFKRGQEWTLALGCAALVEASGRNRWDTAEQAARQGLAPASGPGPHPRLVGGFAFGDTVRAGLWDGFPALRFWLPRRLIVWPNGPEHRAVSWTFPAQSQVAWPNGAGHAMPTTTVSEWDARVGASLELIRSGAVEKVVLARTAAAVSPRSLDPAHAARQLILGDPEATVFIVEPTPGHVLVGATPERLLHIRDGHLSTHALAGSAPSGDEARLGASAKDIHEHEVVADMIVQRLQALGAKPRRGARGVRRMQRISHLETPIDAEAPGLHPFQVAQALHPTPAVSGWPQRAAIDAIARLEGWERGWYTGGVGWIDGRDDADIAVALRCALVRPGGTTLFAGAGLVEGSVAATEWQETETKLASIREALA